MHDHMTNNHRAHNIYCTGSTGNSANNTKTRNKVSDKVCDTPRVLHSVLDFICGVSRRRVCISCNVYLTLGACASEGYSSWSVCVSVCLSVRSR